MKNFILFALLFYSLQSFSQTHNYHAFDGISFIAGGTVYKTQLFSDRFVINDTTYYGQQNFWGRITGSTNDIYNINSGNIGINTTQPLEYKLEVNGNVKISTGQEMSQFASIDSNGTYLSNSYSGSTFSPPDKSPIASATLPSTTYYRSGRLVADYSQSTLQYKNYRLGGINNNSWTITGIYVTEQSDAKKFTGR
ncbi:MAG: hypothetical protein NTW16_07035, partial [Bacteroidetes bacterium]|nr:hypothetical protein [Bacteroidota bacterium]